MVVVENEKSIWDLGFYSLNLLRKKRGYVRCLMVPHRATGHVCGSFHHCYSYCCVLELIAINFIGEGSMWENYYNESHIDMILKL